MSSESPMMQFTNKANNNKRTSAVYQHFETDYLPAFTTVQIGGTEMARLKDVRGIDKGTILNRIKYSEQMLVLEIVGDVVRFRRWLNAPIPVASRWQRFKRLFGIRSYVTQTFQYAPIEANEELQILGTAFSEQP